MATHVLKLLYGADKQSPTRTLDLLTQSGSGPYLRLSGFAPGAGIDNVIWSGQTALRDGQRFVDSTRDNVTLTITYDLSTTSPAELAYHQRQISRFVTDTRLWQRARIGAPVWLRYRWGEGLSAIGEPVLGQFSYYYKVLYAEVERWPNDLHTGALVANYIESVELRLVCEPYVEGRQEQAYDADGLPDVDSDVTVKRSYTSTEVGGSNSKLTFAGWITHRESDYYVFEFYSDADNYVNVFWDESDSRFEINKREAATPTLVNGNAQSLSAGDKVHIVLMNDDTSPKDLIFYINGTKQTNETTSFTFTDTPAGTLTLGSATSAGAVTGNTSGLDAWRLWREAFTQANVTSLYNAEEPVKTAGNTIGPPAYLKTRSGDGVFENVDGVISAAAQDNWGVVGWVPGDAPAKVEWRITPSTTERTFWLGRRAAKSTFTPDGTLWLDYSGTADSGASSGDAYETDTTSGSGTDTHDFDHTITDPEQARGRFQFLGRFKCTGAAIDIEPYFKLGNSTAVKGDTVQIATNASFLFRDFGDWVIDWPPDTETATLGAGLFCTETAASATTVQLDFLQLLPYPNVKVQNELTTPVYGAGDYIVIDGVESYAVDVDDSNSQLNHFSLQGQPVTVLPEYYNYIFLLQATEGVAYAIGGVTQGNNWADVDVWAAGTDDVNCFADDGKGVLMAGGNEGGSAKIATSTDDGATWGATVTVQASDSVTGLATDGNGNWVAVLTGGTIERSTDNGATWALEYTETSGEFFCVAFGNGAFCAGGVDSGTDAIIVRSTDGGDTWTKEMTYNFGDTEKVRSIATDGAGRWMACGDSYDGVITWTEILFTSTDNGDTWTQDTSPTPTWPISIGEDVKIRYGNAVWMIAGDDEIFRTTDEGTTWTSVLDTSTIKTATGAMYARTLAYAGGATWVSVADDNAASETAECYVSTDNGDNWTNRGSTGLSAIKPIDLYATTSFLLGQENDIRRAVGNTSAIVKSLITPRYQLPGGLR